MTHELRCGIVRWKKQKKPIWPVSRVSYLSCHRSVVLYHREKGAGNFAEDIQAVVRVMQRSLSHVALLGIFFVCFIWFVFCFVGGFLGRWLFWLFLLKIYIMKNIYPVLWLPLWSPAMPHSVIYPTLNEDIAHWRR